MERSSLRPAEGGHDLLGGRGGANRMSERARPIIITRTQLYQLPAARAGQQRPADRAIVRPAPRPPLAERAFDLLRGRSELRLVVVVAGVHLVATFLSLANCSPA
jgi:hypothetical protein